MSRLKSLFGFVFLAASVLWSGVTQAVNRPPMSKVNLEPVRQCLFDHGGVYGFWETGNGKLQFYPVLNEDQMRKYCIEGDKNCICETTPGIEAVIANLPSTGSQTGQGTTLDMAQVCQNLGGTWDGTKCNLGTGPSLDARTFCKQLGWTWTSVGCQPPQQLTETRIVERVIEKETSSSSTDSGSSGSISVVDQDSNCPEGQRKNSQGRCVPVCDLAKHERWNSITRQCVCEPGYERDSYGQCKQKKDPRIKFEIRQVQYENGEARIAKLDATTSNFLYSDKPVVALYSIENLKGARCDIVGQKVNSTFEVRLPLAVPTSDYWTGNIMLSPLHHDGEYEVKIVCQSRDGTITESNVIRYRFVRPPVDVRTIFGSSTKFTVQLVASPSLVRTEPAEGGTRVYVQPEDLVNVQVLVNNTTNDQPVLCAVRFTGITEALDGAIGTFRVRAGQTREFAGRFTVRTNSSEVIVEASCRNWERSAPADLDKFFLEASRVSYTAVRFPVVNQNQGQRNSAVRPVIVLEVDPGDLYPTGTGHARMTAFFVNDRNWFNSGGKCQVQVCVDDRQTCTRWVDVHPIRFEAGKVILVDTDFKMNEVMAQVYRQNGRNARALTASQGAVHNVITSWQGRCQHPSVDGGEWFYSAIQEVRVHPPRVDVAIVNKIYHHEDMLSGFIRAYGFKGGTCKFRVCFTGDNRNDCHEIGPVDVDRQDKVWDFTQAGKTVGELFGSWIDRNYSGPVRLKVDCEVAGYTSSGIGEFRIGTLRTNTVQVMRVVDFTVRQNGQDNLFFTWRIHGFRGGACWYTALTDNLHLGVSGLRFGSEQFLARVDTEEWEGSRTLPITGFGQGTMSFTIKCCPSRSPGDPTCRKKTVSVQVNRPAPEVTFTASPTQVNVGQNVLFRWHVKNVRKSNCKVCILGKSACDHRWQSWPSNLSFPSGRLSIPLNSSGVHYAGIKCGNVVKTVQVTVKRRSGFTQYSSHSSSYRNGRFSQYRHSVSVDAHVRKSGRTVCFKGIVRGNPSRCLYRIVRSNTSVRILRWDSVGRYNVWFRFPRQYWNREFCYPYVGHGYIRLQIKCSHGSDQSAIRL